MAGDWERDTVFLSRSGVASDISYINRDKGGNMLSVLVSMCGSRTSSKRATGREREKGEGEGING